MSSPGIRISLAGKQDESELRDLLRKQPLPGWVTLSFEREPNYFDAAACEGERHQVLVARERSDAGETTDVAGICARAVRRVFVDGEAQWLGYLSQFRTTAEWQGGHRAYRLLRHGFGQVRQRLHRPDELPYDITSILVDNRPARRLLSADLPGMPHYHWISGFNTLIYRSGGRRRGSDQKVNSGAAVGLAAIADCLQRNYRRYQFAPVWDEAALLSAGLSAEAFLVYQEKNRVKACISVWDQRSLKQTVVRGYRHPLGLLRPLINLAAPLLCFPALPKKGQSLRQGWLSHLASDQDDSGAVKALLRAALLRARELGLEQLMLGLADAHPLLSSVRAVRRHLSYRSDIYLVHWPELEAGAFDQMSGPSASRPLHLELATL